MHDRKQDNLSRSDRETANVVMWSLIGLASLGIAMIVFGAPNDPDAGIKTLPLLCLAVLGLFIPNIANKLAGIRHARLNKGE